MEKVLNRVDDILSKDYFDKADIVILGESYHGTHDDIILAFLDKNISKIKAVFLEMPMNYQLTIDLYFEKGEVNEHLEGHFQGAEKEGKNVRGILKIFDKIKNAGKKVICIDSSKVQTEEYKTRSYIGHYFLRGKSRDEDMFENISNYYQKYPGKYLTIVGAAHMEMGKHHRSGEDTLGTRMEAGFADKYAYILL